MTPEENRRRIERLRAEEKAGVKPAIKESEYGPAQRRQAQLNKQRMRAT